MRRLILTLKLKFLRRSFICLHSLYVYQPYHDALKWTREDVQKIKVKMLRRRAQVQACLAELAKGRSNGKQI